MIDTSSPLPSRLARQLTTVDAIVVGLGAMIGAGIFVVVGPAVQVAGNAALLALLLAALVAYCNATSSAQLAALYPESGGAYVYGRKRLGHFWGFIAGWGFVIGKMASCAAMALTFASYAAPSLMRPLAITTVLVLTIINCFGVKKSVGVTQAIVFTVLTALAIVVLAVAFGGQTDAARLQLKHPLDYYSILQAAGLWFFAFAGYARLATLGEEVIDPGRTIPRAIILALGLVLLLYFIIAVCALTALDIEVLASSTAPLAAAVEAGDWAKLSPAVRIGACVASLGVLLSLLLGVSRTVFAMAAQRNLPLVFAQVHPRYQVPHRAELGVGIIVALIVAFADMRSAIGSSAFTVLSYYAITNAAALTLNKTQRRWPRWFGFAGLFGCVLLACSLPWSAVISGVTLLLIGSVFFIIREKFFSR